MVRLAGALVSILGTVISIALQITTVLLLMEELDGTMRRDDTVVPLGGSVMNAIPLRACPVL